MRTEQRRGSGRQAYRGAPLGQLLAKSAADFLDRYNSSNNDSNDTINNSSNTNNSNTTTNNSNNDNSNMTK